MLAKEREREENPLIRLKPRKGRMAVGSKTMNRAGEKPKEKTRERERRGLKVTKPKKERAKDMAKSCSYPSTGKTLAKTMPISAPIPNVGMMFPPEKWEEKEKKVKRRRRKSDRSNGPIAICK